VLNLSSDLYNLRFLTERGPLPALIDHFQYRACFPSLPFLAKRGLTEGEDMASPLLTR